MPQIKRHKIVKHSGLVEKKGWQNNGGKSLKISVCLAVDVCVFPSLLHKHTHTNTTNKHQPPSLRQLNPYTWQAHLKILSGACSPVTRS